MALLWLYYVNDRRVKMIDTFNSTVLPSQAGSPCDVLLEVTGGFTVLKTATLMPLDGEAVQPSMVTATV